MLSHWRRAKGMTLIELMIGLALLGILAVLAGPSFSAWMQSSQIRTAAEALQNGLTLARAEAVRRNTAVRFQLVSTVADGCALASTGTNWVVSLDDPTGSCADAASDNVAPRIIQTRDAAEGSPNAVADAAGVTTVVFNRNGGVAPPANIVINVTNPTGGLCAQAGGPMRCLRVTVSAGGQVRMCDPARAAGDPQGC